VPAGPARLEIAVSHHFLNDFCEIEPRARPGVHPVLDARQREQLLDHPVQPARLPLDSRQILARIERGAAVVGGDVNGGVPVGSLGSPLFGQSTGLAGTFSQSANRQVHLQLQFLF